MFTHHDAAFVWFLSVHPQSVKSQLHMAEYQKINCKWTLKKSSSNYLWGILPSLEQMLKIKKTGINLCRGFIFKSCNIYFS